MACLSFTIAPARFLFTRVVERRSFTQAANDIGLPRSTATQVIHQFERRLGVRLLQRTTRVVWPTLDGEAYYRRVWPFFRTWKTPRGAFSGMKPKGMLRVEVQGTLARHFLMPNLPAFLARYPEIEISMRAIAGSTLCTKAWTARCSGASLPIADWWRAASRC
jgi:DNA-binding transcriptional LysR family regulator